MRALTAVLIVSFSSVAVTAARAGDSAPVIVIPGRADVPVMIDGYDASYAVVEGDWGLYRPGHVHPRIIYGPVAIPAPVYGRGYYPAYGRRPGYGRHEIQPPANRVLPVPAQSYRRDWTTQSDPIPATLDPPANPPPVIVAPRFGERQFHPHN
jgi:hypothetical protein